MEPVFNDMDELIGKVLAGEATAQERAQVDGWIKQSEANQKYVEQLKLIFDRAASEEILPEFDTEAAWTKVKGKLESGKVAELKPRSEEKAMWLRIAAGIAIVMGVVYFINNPIAPPPPLAIASTDSTRQDTLPDGSTTFLNKQSQLSYTYSAKEKSRKVVLTGEAYFTVKHDEEKPFVIEADEVLVRDIGTEFNLKAYPDKDTIEIIVTEGEVQFYTKDDPGLILKAGEKAIYSKSGKQFYRIERLDTNALAYKTKVFSFNNTELLSVVTLLNEIYNSKIKLANENLFGCRLTANFKEDNALIIAEVIAETMGLTLTQNGNEIILDGAGCNP